MQVLPDLLRQFNRTLGASPGATEPSARVADPESESGSRGKEASPSQTPSTRLAEPMPWPAAPACKVLLPVTFNAPVPSEPLLPTCKVPPPVKVVPAELAYGGP